MTDTSRFTQYRQSLLQGETALYSEQTVVAQDADHVIYYTPFEYENPLAKLVLVGISPGPDQLRATYAEGPKLLSRGQPDLEVLSALKRHGAFGGDLRSNLCKMLAHFRIDDLLGLRDVTELWSEGWPSFYATSVVPNAAFYRNKRGKNGLLKLFAGSFEDILKSAALRSEFEGQFLTRLQRINKHARYIALGPTPRAALDHAASIGVIGRDQLLGSFAHPSNAAHPQVDIYLQRKKLEDLHPKSPVRHRVARLTSDFLEMSNNVNRWRAVPGNDRCATLIAL
jgi:hypothetical protein